MKIEKDLLDRNATINAMKRQIEKIENSQPPRQYLGFSQIGDDCQRKLWYDFRKVSFKQFKAETILKFKDGFIQEDVAALRLSLVPGVKLLTRNSSGEQFGYRLLNGHFNGHCDGHIEGILEAPKTPHIWEHKSSEEMEKLDKIISEVGTKSALKKWNYTYYIQAQLYMYCQDFTRHFLTCSAPGGRDYTSCRTELDKDVAENAISIAEAIIKAERPLPKLSEKAEFYKCAWCASKDVCHFDAVPIVNCRTCAFSEPDLSNTSNSGGWICHKKNKNIDFNKQLTGCNQHLFLNTLLPFDAVDCDTSVPIPNWIKYKKDNFEFYNCNELSKDLLPKDSVKYTSMEIYKLEYFTEIFSMVEKVKQEFNGIEPIVAKEWEKTTKYKGLDELLK